MKKGFILIEVLVSLVISSMLAASLLTFLYQLSRVQTTVNDLVMTSGRAAIVQHQMTRDLMGSFVPGLADIQLPTEKEKKEEQAKKEAEAKKKEEKPVEKKEKIKSIEKVFYGVRQAEKLDTLTFITSNPMQLYGSTEQAKPRPRIVRVVYRLVPDKERKNSYTLTRQEGSSLYFDAYKPEAKDIPTYDVIDGIKNFSVQYTAIVEKKSEKNGEEKKGEREYKKFNEWKEQKERKEEEKQLPPLPHLVEIQCVLWDSSYKRDTTYIFTVPIVAEYKVPQKKQPDQEQQAR